MKVEIKHGFSGNAIFECELAASYGERSRALQLGAAVKVAISSNADLRGADLCGADLRGADLRDADLRNANLRDADLSDADLRGADLRDADLRDAYLSKADLCGAYLRDAYLSDADLSDADLRGANLRGADLGNADLSGADLSGAYLEPIKNDMFAVLLRSIPEMPALEKAIKAGKVDGSTYGGECACLCGTIEKARGVGRCDMRDSSRPIERFFLGISPGDTPENNQFSKLALEWIREFRGYINGTTP